jgi:hypothetical protein
LIAIVGSLEDVTFLKNGTEIEPHRFARHLREKWDVHKSKIRSARDFISLAASYSSVSGQFYMARLAGGQKVRVNEMLWAHLDRLESR